jgi:hypothetical protein
MKTWALTLVAGTTLALGAQTAGAANAFTPGPARIDSRPAVVRSAPAVQHSFAPLAGLPLLVLRQPRNAAERTLVAELGSNAAPRVPDTWARRLLTRLIWDLS